MDAYWSPTEKLHVQRMLARSIVGSKSAVKAELKEFLVETGAGEVIIAFDIYDHKARLRSQELAAQCMTEL
jgi:alkanesulfonate monooxygenase SsuD/methylene tetrahydromethanopterin reductase-like flavin-dependent oxidoreductase (luciferase family)